VEVVPDLPPLPDDAMALSDALRRGLDRVLGDAFASLFLYGAVAFPRPEHWRIDFDFHALLLRPLEEEERRGIESLYAELAQRSELGADLDGYFVLLADAARSEPPCHQLRTDMRDEAWALHRAHVHAGRYFLISGIDPLDVVPEPTWAELETGLGAEIRFVASHPDARAFSVLNAARILYSFETHDVVLSKYQAGQWALASLPPEWHEALRAAQRWYERASLADDERILREVAAPFVSYVSRSLPIS
jgi:hypothetical protein